MNIMIAAVFVSLICAFAVFPQDEGQAIEQTVKTLERDLSAAIAKGDAAIVDRILAHDYIEVTAQGLVRNKSDVMAFVRARASAPKAISAGPEVSVTDLEVRIYGEDVAVLVGLKTTKYQHMEYQVSPGSGQLPPPDFTDKERFMRIYVRRSNVWRRVASQITNVAAVPSHGPDKPVPKL